MNRVFVLLGSNIDKERNLPAAAALLRKHGLVRVSAAYETVPVGTDDLEPFLNAAAELLTPLDPQTFKSDVCGGIERALGRIRVLGDRFAPRTIDVDIALWNDEVLDAPGLPVPDPDILRHLHAVLPLSDLAPDLCHPTDGRTLGAIARDMAERVAPGRLLDPGSPAKGSHEGHAPALAAMAPFPRRRPDVIM